MGKARKGTSEKEARRKHKAQFCIGPKGKQQLFPASDSGVVHTLEKAGKMVWGVQERW